MKKLMIYLLIGAAVYGSEIDFTQGKMGELILLPQGGIRVREDFIPGKTEKEIVIKNMYRGVDRGSLIVENEGIEEFTFGGEFDDNDDFLKNQNVIYKGAEYKLLTTAPLSIESLKNGEVIINPSGEMRFKPSERKKGYSLTLQGEKDISHATLNYALEGLTWGEEYHLYLDKDKIKKILFIRNNSDKKFENILVKFAKINENETFERFDLNPFTEIKKNLFIKRTDIVKNYIYNESRKEKNPELSLEVKGVGMTSHKKVKVFNEDQYMGEFTGFDKKDEIEITGLSDSDIEVELSESKKNLGTRLKHRKVTYSIKNYKKEPVILKIIYDKLPEKWDEFRSEEGYEIVGKAAVLTLKLPENSTKEIKFSFVEEKN